MEDRYLFKAKRIDNGEWVIGFYVRINESDFICTRQLIHGRLYTVSKSFKVNQSTICQCTGLKDKNDKLIWENDILNGGNLVVTWREELASYCLTKKGWMYQHFFGEAVDACDCEVIGNVFDNPELLESEVEE